MIINQIVQGGGVTPTGTKGITANGTYDVTNYASADVQVPTTAPACYLALEKNSSNKLVHSTTTPFTPIPAGTTSLDDYIFYKAYSGASPSAVNGQIDLSSLTVLNGAQSCAYMFENCTGITSVDLSSVSGIAADITAWYMFSGCTGITTVNLSSLANIGLSQSAMRMFYGCTSLTGVSLPALTSISGTKSASYMFANNTSLATANMPILHTISGGNCCEYMFSSCSFLTSLDMSELVSITGSSGCTYMFSYCSGLTNVELSSLTTLTGAGALVNTFQYCTGLTKLSFPSLRPTSFGSATNYFGNMLLGCDGTTVHFPSNVEAKIGTWGSVTTGFGGTNITVLFDLPSTSTLTGADSATYTRNPKYDTATALAWKVGAYTTTNFTPAYYTSGTTDPQANDTIYSDAACTTAVTTISAIA